MVKFLAASAVILAVMVGWLYVQHIYRRFARGNPQLGPFRSEATCQGSCGCHQGSCTPNDAAPASVRLEMPEIVKYKGALQ
ncbi:MAG: hypothetical protein KDJ24_17610 [Gammaproteobacteria bacterium]|nr:hypothetical protein [Gammaproteobacteria bacterium]